MLQLLRLPFAGIIVFVLLITPGVIAGVWFVNQLTAFSSQQENVELVVIDAPDGFEVKASSLGFKIETKSVLKELEITAFRVLAPKGMTAVRAKKVLIVEFPSLIVEIKLESGAYKTSSQ